jgi:hypothetical protein
MEKKIFQSGGPIIDEDELFEDGSVAQGKNQFRRHRRRLVEEQIILRKILQKLLTLTNLQDM